MSPLAPTARPSSLDLEILPSGECSNSPHRCKQSLMCVLACCRIWNVEAGKEEFKLEGHQGLVHSVAISIDGATIVSGSEDKTIR